MPPLPDRRDTLHAAVAGAAVLAAAAGPAPAAAPDRPVRVGFVGVGVKGWQHVRNLLHIDGCEVRAVCDVRPEACEYVRGVCRTLGKPAPAVYTKGPEDFRRLCEADLDLVYTATPWEWHVPVCLAAMKAGKHAATEIPAAVTLDECWQLVETAEQTGRHCCMMENVNYRREELAILRLVRAGGLGELVHGEGGYMHDTRYLKARTYGDGLWLGAHHARRNGNLYPCHGVGPLAWYFDLGRGNRMEYLVSMSSKARGMNLYAREHLPKGHPHRERDYVNGDVNTCLIRTSNGETLVLKHDTDLPRPYSRTNLVQGTRGMVRGYPAFTVSLEKDLVKGIDDPNREHAYKGPHDRYARRPGTDLYKEYDHPLWTALAERAKATPVAADGFKLADEIASGDYLEDLRLIEALRAGTPPDYDVYDAAGWSAIAPLSERSVADRSRPVDVPDFTRGKWKARPPLRLMGV